MKIQWAPKTGRSIHGMFEFLTELGKALISAGISVTAVQSILEDITEAYNLKAEIIVFPHPFNYKIR